MAVTPDLARRMWRTLEPYHAVMYFAGDTRERTDRLGLKGGWMSYFGCRAAPLGAVPAEVVTAVFYNFHPTMVARAIPDAWQHAAPEALLEARTEAVDAALRRILGDAVTSPEMAEAAALAKRAAEGADTAGRPLAAANSALPWPSGPHLVLWQATTILREARGDGHVAALVAAGLDPCMALVTLSASGGPPKEVFILHRRWSDQEWQDAIERLHARGWMDGDGDLTTAGHAGRQGVEDVTDRLAATTWAQLGEPDAVRLQELVREFSRTIAAAGFLPVPNPIGLTWSEDLAPNTP